MTIRFNIGSPIARWAAVAGLAAAAAFWAFPAIFSKAVSGTLADPRFEFDSATLRRGLLVDPSQPGLRARVADAAFEDGRLDEAVAQADAAVRLSPNDYRLRIARAELLEAAGRRAAAGDEFAFAATLAPNFSAPRWALANFLLRQGDAASAAMAGREFRRAVELAPDLADSAFDLFCQKTGGDLASLRTVAGEDPELRLVMATALARRGLTDAAKSVAAEVPPGAPGTSPGRTTALVEALRAGGASGAAYDLWRRARGSFDDSNLMGMSPSGKNSAPAVSPDFGWRLSDSQFAKLFVVNDGAAASENGRQSALIKLTYAGRDTTRLAGEIGFRAGIRTGVRYRLEFRYRTTENPELPSLPRWAVAAADSKTSQPPAASSGALLTETSPLSVSADWRPVAADFTIPRADRVDAEIEIFILQTPRYSFEEPSAGSYEFRDFSLREVTGR